MDRQENKKGRTPGSPGVLYIVPTPVGNLEDMTFRAVSVLKSADIILAEDTRTSSVLLKHYGIQGRLESHHKFNEHKTVPLIRDRILEGLDVALISDAGTPGISDPGFLLVRACAEEGIEVQTLPGPTAFVPAIVSSGFPCDRFCFEGFLPVKKGRLTRLQSLASETRTMIFYESPYRLVKTLGQFAEFFGPDSRNKRIVLYPDRAGNKRREELEQITTDSLALKRELESYGFSVQLMNEGLSTIYHWQQFKLMALLFGGKSNALPEVLIDENECPNLCSAIPLSPRLTSNGRIELDKSSEKRIPLHRQAGLTTQLPSAMIYLLYGLYSDAAMNELSSLPDSLMDNITL